MGENITAFALPEVYEDMDYETREFCRMKENSIKSRSMQVIIEVGRDLSEVKDILEHGLFQAWLKQCFDMTVRTAQNYMQIYRQFKNEPGSLLENFSRKALTLLSSKDTPESVKRESFSLASAGEYVDVDKVNELKRKVDLLENEKKTLEYNIDSLRETFRQKEQLVSALEQSEAAITQDRNELYQKFEELKSELDILKFNSDKSVREIRDVVEVPGPERIIEKVPQDYHDLKNKSDSLFSELDRLRVELDKEKDSADKIRRELNIKEAVTRIEDGISLLYGALRTDGLESWEIPLVLQYTILDVISCLSKLCVVESDVVSEQSSRERLLRAGFTLIRIQEDDKMIRQYTGNGGWKVHSKYETKKALRRSLAELMADEKILIA